MAVDQVRYWRILARGIVSMICKNTTCLFDLSQKMNKKQLDFYKEYHKCPRCGGEL